MQRSALCRSRRELSNEYLLAKFGFDAAEHGPSKVWRYGVSGVSGLWPGLCVHTTFREHTCHLSMSPGRKNNPYLKLASCGSTSLSSNSLAIVFAVGVSRGANSSAGEGRGLQFVGRWNISHPLREQARARRPNAPLREPSRTGCSPKSVSVSKFCCLCRSSLFLSSK